MYSIGFRSELAVIPIVIPGSGFIPEHNSRNRKPDITSKLWYSYYANAGAPFQLIVIYLRSHLYIEESHSRHGRMGSAPETLILSAALVTWVSGSLDTLKQLASNAPATIEYLNFIWGFPNPTVSQMVGAKNDIHVAVKCQLGDSCNNYSANS